MEILGYVFLLEKEKKINNLTGHLQTDIYFSTLKYSYFNFAREEFYKLVVSMLSTPITLHKGEAPSLSCPNGSLTES